MTLTKTKGIKSSLTLIFFIILSTCTLNAQSTLNLKMKIVSKDSFDLTKFYKESNFWDNANKSLNYLNSIKQVAKFYDTRKSLNENNLDRFMSHTGALLSFWGRYDDAKNLFLEKFEINQFKCTKEDSLIINASKIKKISMHDLNYLASKQVVMINEAHHLPNHRIFTYSLLKFFYNKGFKYFACETITNPTIDSNYSKINLYHGYYSNEPTYANMLRYARDIGFKIVGYDVSGGISEREDGESKNIAKLFQKDTSAKVLIHCGYSHAEKRMISQYEWLASRLISKFNLDIATISQTTFSPSSYKITNNFIYQHFQNKLSGSPKIVYQSGINLTTEVKDSLFDFNVITPKYYSFSKKYLRKFTNLKYKRIRLLDRGVLLQTFPQEEIKETTDFDRVIPSGMYLQSTKDKKFHILLLPKGKHLLIFRNIENKIIFKKTIRV